MCNLLVKTLVFGLLLLSPSISAKRTTKRGIHDFGLGGFAGGYNGLAAHDSSFGFPGLFSPQPLPIFVKGPILSPGLTIQKHYSYQSPISPTEIASAVSAAKEASNRVMYAQQRVQQAKEALLEQQHIAREKESQAALALQRSEAAAAAQRQAASAAANAVVQAQQRLAEAKSQVAEQQKIAAVKESIAALAIHKSASAAAAEIQRTEDTAAKIAALQRSEAAAAIKYVTAAKDASLSATGSAVAAAAAANAPQPPPQHHNPQPYHPWS